MGSYLLSSFEGFRLIELMGSFLFVEGFRVRVYG